VHEWVLLIRIRPPVHGCAARRLAGDDHFVRVAAKSGDVRVQPFHSKTLVSQTKVRVSTRSTWEPEDVHAVIDRNKDDIFSLCEVLTIGEWSIGVSTSEA
jgi:hypothetical protein